MLRTKPLPAGIAALVVLPGQIQTCRDAAPAFAHPAITFQSSFAAALRTRFFLPEPPVAFRG